MQTLEVISVNVWQIIISLCNLLILFLIIKKFLFQPVQKMLDKRKASLDAEYDAAAYARQTAEEQKAVYTDKLAGADAEATEIIKKARENAQLRSTQIISSAEEKAAGMVRRANEDIELEKRKAMHDLKGEIVDISMELTEKVLGRELNENDHREMIDEFIEGIGEFDD